MSVAGGVDWEPQRLVDGMLKTSSTTPVEM